MQSTKGKLSIKQEDQKVNISIKSENKQQENYQNMIIRNIEEDKLKCYYHPNKTITNFCEQQKCLLPMCPDCVSIHTDYHNINKSQGQFKSLTVIIESLIDEIQRQSQQVKQNEDQLSEFEYKINNEPHRIRNQFQQLKVQALKAVEDSFEKLNNILEEKIINYQNQNQSQISLLESQLEQYHQTLIEILSDINNDPLPTIVKLKSENTLVRLKQQMPVMSIDFNSNQSLAVDIQPDLNNIYTSLTNFIDSLLFLPNNTNTFVQNTTNYNSTTSINKNNNNYNNIYNTSSINNENQNIYSYQIQSKNQNNNHVIQNKQQLQQQQFYRQPLQQLQSKIISTSISYKNSSININNGNNSPLNCNNFILNTNNNNPNYQQQTVIPQQKININNSSSKIIFKSSSISPNKPIPFQVSRHIPSKSITLSKQTFNNDKSQNSIPSINTYHQY